MQQNELTFAFPLGATLFAAAVLINAAVAVAAEQKWGRSGLRWTWIIMLLVVPSAELAHAASSLSDQLEGPRGVVLLISMALVFVSIMFLCAGAFGATTLSIRAVGAFAPRPRGVIARLAIGAIAGFAGGATMLALLVGAGRLVR